MGIAATFRVVSVYCLKAQGAKESTFISVLFTFDSTVTMLVRVAALGLGTLGFETINRDNSKCCCYAQGAKENTVIHLILAFDNAVNFAKVHEL